MARDPLRNNSSPSRIQRLAHGEIEIAEYLGYLSSHTASAPRLSALWGRY
jgi:hypothetical protein